MDVLAVGLATDAVALGGINVALWIASLFIGKTWPVDFIWSGFPPAMAVRILLGNDFGGLRERQIIVCSLVAVWGYRLTHNFVARGGIGHEDWRYTDMRAQFGRHFWWISLFSVFLGQTIFLFAACLGMYGALLRPGALSAADAIGACVCAGSILLEAAADMQMDDFQQGRREKRHDQTVLYAGLWKWSRHPNYLGEMGWWWGLYAFGAPYAPAWVAAGPGAITFLFCAISVKLMEDRQMASKPQAYSEYKRLVPSSLLLLPPPLNRAIGRVVYGGSASSTTPVMS